MKHKFSFAIAATVLATSLPLAGALLAQDPQPSPPSQEQSQNSQSEAQMFSGKVVKSSGKYTLRNSSGKISYVLDDQKTAKKYEGKVVMVTGTLDEANNIIHVQKIEAAA